MIWMDGQTGHLPDRYGWDHISICSVLCQKVAEAKSEKEEINLQKTLEKDGDATLLKKLISTYTEYFMKWRISWNMFCLTYTYKNVVLFLVNYFICEPSMCNGFC